MKRLAIIIPAYKATFLDASLASIAAQTCQDFTLYIGDDCSPYGIEGIVAHYREKIDLVYKRFSSNLGGKDLVAQWERCIDMNRGEEWLWLFSDDDEMDPRCVETFYKTLEEHPNCELFHFNISIIDANGQVKAMAKRYPTHLTALEYLDKKFHAGLNSFVVEFIYKRDLFFRNRRFENFDMAWGSDMVTWIKLADSTDGITTMDGPDVRWRYSGENISPDKSQGVLLRKLHAEMENALWIKGFLMKHGIAFSYRWYKFFYGELFRNRKLLPWKNGVRLSAEYGKRTGIRLQSAAFILCWNIIKVIRL